MKDIPNEFILNDLFEQERYFQTFIKIEDQEQERIVVIAKELSSKEDDNLFVFQCKIDKDQYAFSPIHDPNAAELISRLIQEAALHS